MVTLGVPKACSWCTWRWQTWLIWRVLILHLSLKTRTKCYSITVRVSKECLSHSIHRTQWHSPDFHCFLPWNLGSSWRHCQWGGELLPVTEHTLSHKTKVNGIFLSPSQGRKNILAWLSAIMLWVVLRYPLASRLGTPHKALSSSKWTSKESLQLFLLQYLSTVQLLCWMLSVCPSGSIILIVLAT